MKPGTGAGLEAAGCSATARCGLPGSPAAKLFVRNQRGHRGRFSGIANGLEFWPGTSRIRPKPVRCRCRRWDRRGRSFLPPSRSLWAGEFPICRVEVERSIRINVPRQSTGVRPRVGTFRQVQREPSCERSVVLLRDRQLEFDWLDTSICSLAADRRVLPSREAAIVHASDGGGSGWLGWRDRNKCRACDNNDPTSRRWFSCGLKSSQVAFGARTGNGPDKNSVCEGVDEQKRVRLSQGNLASGHRPIWWPVIRTRAVRALISGAL